jgi:uncharacterized protein involved in exopolysaccharide biosynthesis
VALFWRRKLLIMLVAAGMVAATFPLISRLPNLYESRALVLVAGQADEAQGGGGQITGVIQQLLSRASLATLAQRYQLNQAPEDFDAAAQRLRKEIKLETKLRDYYPQVPDSVALSYRHPNPRLAQQVLVDLVAHFEAANETRAQQVTSETRRITAELAELEELLRQFGEQKADAAKRTATAGQESTDLRTRFATVAAMETLSDREYALQQQLSQQQRLIAEQLKVVKAVPPARDGAYGALLVRKTELEALLKEYAAQYTDKNPKVSQARAQLAEVNRQLAPFDVSGASPGSATASPEAQELRALQRDLARLETDLGVTQRELERKKQQLAALPASDGRGADTEMASKSARAEVEYDRLSKRYVWLLDKQYQLPKASVVAGGETGAGLFKIIDRPSLSQSPVAPNRFLLKLMALAAALLAGLLLAAAVEVPRLFLIHDPRDIEYFLGAPVLGLLPETLTPVERRHRRRQQWVKGLALALLVTALVPAVTLLLDRLQIFQMVANR